MSWFWAIITFLNNLWSAWKEIQAAADKKRAADAELKRQGREKALQELDKAEADEEIFDAQTKIIDNKP